MNSSSLTAFVTGATGLLGNNLVRQLAARGIRVKALARSKEKAEKLFVGLPVEVVTGDMRNIAGFAQHLRGTDILFHAAAYFRDNFKGGRHRNDLYQTNVLGTRDLLSHAYTAGIRRIVHTSSTSVLDGPAGTPINETMLRSTDNAADYPLSKILSDREVSLFLQQHPDAFACFVLPGWMVGPGDAGPTSSGQLILDFLKRKLPGIPPGGFSTVDARDVAEAHIEGALHGTSGGRYIAAGRTMEIAELSTTLEKLTGIPAPKRRTPLPMLYAFAALNEVWHFISRRPALISVASVNLMARSRNISGFDQSRTERELGIRFRPLEETLRDTVAWYRQNGWLKDVAIAPGKLYTAGGSI